MLDKTLAIDFSRHYVIHNVELLRLLGIDAEEIPEPELWLTSEDVAAADQYLGEQGIRPGDMLVGIHPGGNRWIMKQWPKEYFAALIERLGQEYPGVRVLLLGGPDEEAVKQEIAAMTAYATPTVVGVLPLRQTAALIQRCQLFIGNDSSLMHIAAAVKTPVVGIFGSSLTVTGGSVAMNPHGCGIDFSRMAKV